MGLNGGCLHNTLRLVRSVAAALAPRLMEELESLFGVPVIQTCGTMGTTTAFTPAFAVKGVTQSATSYQTKKRSAASAENGLPPSRFSLGPVLRCLFLHPCQQQFVEHGEHDRPEK